MDECVVLTPTGCIGNRGIHGPTFWKALDEYKVQAIASDAGSYDPGPHYLGAGIAHSPHDVIYHDLDLCVSGAVEKKIPLLIGLSLIHI